MNGEDLRYLLKVREDISRAMNDTRFPNPNRWGGDLRMFVVTAIWVLGVERAPRGARIKRTCEVMGLDNFRFWELIRSDLPRYEPDPEPYDAGCVAELPRAKRLCGRSPMVGFQVTNPVDGTWQMARFCSRHRQEADAANAAEKRRRDAGLPVPLPNRGGLLPCYLPWDWEKNYRKADGSWAPPKVGIRADDWPVLARVEAARPVPPVLSVVLGGLELPTPSLEEADDAVPAPLHLISAPVLDTPPALTRQSRKDHQ
ncbi:hypothetical protein [Nonomuraea wenchangensis]|uniref:Uncharacterized protein n=1 Tax=Nonomuraea wenchangensis TaxID=568860 RepID=A0A1I0F0E0_9ACTN|nr:hypothetical protein [Nonomuraea wenchangensis]SET51097.1 hypothetical protein SAMN05421811_103266 [Nonomuraea wenchangensis]